MSFKKPLLVSTHPSSYICWNCLLNRQPSSQVSSTRHRPSRPRRKGGRSYATVASSNDTPELHWPELGDPRRIPTPYQIFNQRPGEAYSKRRFYELVKLYHPDRTNANGGGDDASSITIERYRLVIAANAILSDPERRSAYDRLGAGWSHYHENSDMNRDRWKHDKYSTYHRWKAEYAAKWTAWSTEGDPMYNATWEDWERWYERQRDPEGYARRNSWHATFFSSRSPQSAVFVNNYVFLSLVAILAALGGIGQATRMNQLQDSRQQRISAINERVGRELLDARNDAREDAETQSKQDRIRKWVRQREGYGEGELDGRTTHVDQDFCGSALVKDRDEVPFWKRPPEEWER